MPIPVAPVNCYLHDRSPIVVTGRGGGGGRGAGAALGPSVAQRLLRGYGPLAAAALAFLVMAALVPTVPQEVRIVGGRAPLAAGDTPGPAGGAAAGPETPVTSGPAARSPRASEATGGPPPSRGTGASGSAAISGAGQPAAAPAAPRSAPGARLGPCSGRTRQVANDPYSPPCFGFSGDNGGATNRGVSATEVVVSARVGGFPEFSIQPDDGPATTFSIDPEEYRNALVALAEYFNARFQFYGRRLRMAFYDARGNVLEELQGGGQEGAEADGVKAAEEVKAFVEVSAFTAPFADALSRRSVVNVGAPYLSQEWLAERRPYAWSPAPDCTFIQQSVSGYLVRRVASRPARHAGGALAGKPRRLGMIAPDNPWYQQCADSGERALRKEGVDPGLRLAYRLNFSTLSNQAASLVAKLRNAGVTTVVCGCDPALPLFLTSKAREQGYEPEWIVTGAAGMDLDPVAQLYQQDAWARAFGVSFLGSPQPVRATYGYAAFKMVRPDQEPPDIIDLLYYQMYLVALGVQMAGPILTPGSFAAGLYAYPGGSGPAGTWRFSPGRSTPTQDAREVYWDPRRRSTANGKNGAYVETEPGRRYGPAEWPPGDAPASVR
ncbi:MAG TPA: ABC transporter substrate-binding protein [Acidimicrobiia bacterium]|nr:ABC transporter substrate-binding protein [Acidimicrobiia bacterium]